MPNRRSRAGRARGHRASSDEGVVTQMLERLKSGGDVRQRKVRRIRASVRAGAYDNDLKLSIALDRLMRKLARE